MSLTLRWSPYIPRLPYPAIERTDPPSLTPKQWAFLVLDCEEAFYGGAAGGAKSDALLMAALQYTDVPGYAALLLRGTFAELAMPNAIMDRAKSWLLPQGIPWNQDLKRFTFPSGATLTFGYLDHQDDRFRYQGPEFQFLGFDEVTQFRQEDYTWMFSRRRRLEGSEVPLRTRSTGNPDGPGFEWVRQRFIVEGRDRGIPFIPSTLDDNPYIDRAEYIKSLDHLDSITRQRLLHGNWDVRPSGGIYLWWPRYRVEELPALRKIVIPMDTALGGKDYSAWSAWGFDGAKAYLLDAGRYQGEQPEAMRRVQHFRLKIGQQYPGVPVLPLHRDNVHIDKIAAQYLRAGAPSTAYTSDGVASPSRVGMPVGGVKLPSMREGTSDKNRAALARLSTVEFEGGRMLIPDHAPWLKEWQDEHIAFPDPGGHDDWVECTIMTWWHLFRAAPWVAPPSTRLVSQW